MKSFKSVLLYLLLPILTSVIAGVIVYTLNTYYISDLFEGWRSIAFSGYPKLGKAYRVIYPGKIMPYERATLKQVGSRISGEIFSQDDKAEFIGHISPTRHITYQFQSTDSKKNDFGVGFLKLSNDGKTATGYVLLLSDNYQEPYPLKLQVVEQIP